MRLSPNSRWFSNRKCAVTGLRRRKDGNAYCSRSCARRLASLLLVDGVDLVTVSARLGHSSVATTAAIYSHAIRGKDRAAAQVWDDLIQQSRGERPTGVNYRVSDSNCLARRRDGICRRHLRFRHTPGPRDAEAQKLDESSWVLSTLPGFQLRFDLQFFVNSAWLFGRLTLRARAVD